MRKQSLRILGAVCYQASSLWETSMCQTGFEVLDHPRSFSRLLNVGFDNLSRFILSVDPRCRIGRLTGYYAEIISPKPPVGRKKRIVALPPNIVWTDDLRRFTTIERYARTGIRRPKC